MQVWEDAVVRRLGNASQLQELDPLQLLPSSEHIYKRGLIK